LFCFQTSLAEKLNIAAHIDPVVSCRTLELYRKYALKKFEKVQNPFNDTETTFIATLDSGSEEVLKVFLPSRISTKCMSDAEMKNYNSEQPSLYLIFKGMLGKCIDIDILPL
jgi:hypothetical protein